VPPVGRAFQAKVSGNKAGADLTRLFSCEMLPEKRPVLLDRAKMLAGLFQVTALLVVKIGTAARGQHGRGAEGRKRR